MYDHGVPGAMEEVASEGTQHRYAAVANVLIDEVVLLSQPARACHLLSNCRVRAVIVGDLEEFLPMFTWTEVCLRRAMLWTTRRNLHLPVGSQHFPAWRALGKRASDLL